MTRVTASGALRRAESELKLVMVVFTVFRDVFTPRPFDVRVKLVRAS